MTKGKLMTFFAKSTDASLRKFNEKNGKNKLIYESYSRIKTK